MKKLIAIIIALCAISGYPMDVVSELLVYLRSVMLPHMKKLLQ